MRERSPTPLALAEQLRGFSSHQITSIKADLPKVVMATKEIRLLQTSNAQLRLAQKWPCSLKGEIVDLNPS